ncbi:hypothetical protein AWW66_29150 [Micromonospora rosaria]|uniref:Uncharacterized protein n=2 Tax=Micromonospora rosaria TaxID=47874 RepID=A0A136PJI6_9ACTN|nr:hypothetical protein [Micromonospora rosaria]KXK58554.1 hypothetical protein AWW66_29150 [Micromonospora rosaria]
MGLFSGGKKKPKDVDAPRSCFETPPPGGTAHQRRVAAFRREHELMNAISKRGRELRLDPDKIVDAQLAAQEELRRRGMAPEQLPPGDPVDDFIRYGI